MFGAGAHYLIHLCVLFKEELLRLAGRSFEGLVLMVVKLLGQLIDLAWLHLHLEGSLLHLPRRSGGRSGGCYCHRLFGVDFLLFALVKHIPYVLVE